MDTKNYDLCLYCDYADLRKIIKILYDYTDGFVEFDFTVERVSESSVVSCNEAVSANRGIPDAINDKYQIVSFSSCSLEKVFDFLIGLSKAQMVEDTLNAYAFVYQGIKVIYVLPL